MNNFPDRVVIENHAVDFIFDDQLIFLTVTIQRRSSGPLMFMWKPESGARTVEILQDSSSDLEVANDLPISAFPIREVIDLVDRNKGQFVDDVRNSILAVLKSVSKKEP